MGLLQLRPCAPRILPMFRIHEGRDRFFAPAEVTLTDPLTALVIPFVDCQRRRE